MNNKVFRFSPWPVVFVNGGMFFFAVIAIASSAPPMFITTAIVFFLFSVPLSYLHLRNRRVLLLDDSLIDIGWLAKKRTVVAFSEILEITHSAGEHDGGSVTLRTSKGPISIGSLRGYGDLIRELCKRNPNLKVPPGLI